MGDHNQTPYNILSHEESDYLGTILQAQAVPFTWCDKTSC
jgi:hypothetical protein